MRYLLLAMVSFFNVALGQVKPLADNKPALATDSLYSRISLSKTTTHHYPVQLDAGVLYQFFVEQQGIDVALKLVDPNNKQLVDKDSPNGTEGPENFSLIPELTGRYMLSIMPFNDSTAAGSGNYSIYVRKFTPTQMKRMSDMKPLLEEENKKNVLTLDIDHFWDAVDHLADCKTRKDSVNCFQERYIDIATAGFKEFLEVRGFTAAEYVRTLVKYPKFYYSIRKNTYEVKKAAPLIEQVFENFKKLYPEFKPFKVCFAIGTVRTGGTTSSNFVLIGTEITVSTKENDLTEFNGDTMGKVLAGETDIVQKIKNIVAHECVHTQQKNKTDESAQRCDLLYACLMEGSCDFIGELVAGNQLNKVSREYGDKHEAVLWKEFKKELCSESLKNWLYNYKTSKDRPADLGYYIGYRIAKAYYNKQKDKTQAIRDIIDMKDPLKILQLSGYAENL